MSTIRVEHSNRYTCISNAAIQDNTLSFKARGLHHLLLSYPDGFKVKRDSLINKSDKDGKTAIDSALKELEEAGYLTRRKFQDEKGQWQWDSIIREAPSKDPTPPPTSEPVPETRKPSAVKQDAGIQDDGKPYNILSNKYSSNNYSSNDQDLSPLPPKTGNGKERKLFQSRDRFTERFSPKEQPWKTGSGVNDFDNQFLEWLQSSWKQETSANAKAFLRKAKRDEERYDNALGYWDDYITSKTPTAGNIEQYIFDRFGLINEVPREYYQQTGRMYFTDYTNDELKEFIQWMEARNAA